MRTLTLIFLGGLLYAEATAQQFEANLDWAVTRQGQVRQVFTNMGSFLGHRVELGYPGLVNSEFPAGSFEEHLGEGGIWVGGVTPQGDTLVTSSLGWAPGPYFWETFPSSAPWDTIWTVGRGETADIPYWPGYTGISDQDMVMRYNDYEASSLLKADHSPLYLEFIQTVYEWSGPKGLDEVVVLNYYITPVRFDIERAYISLWVDPNVGNISYGANFLDDRSLFFDDLLLAVGEDAAGGTDGDTESPIGFMLFPPDGYRAGDLRWSWQWGSQPFAPGMIPATDEAKYTQLMTRGRIQEDQVQFTGSHFVFSFGPVNLTVGDTLHFMAAEVFGEGLSGLLENATLVQRLARQNFQLPAPPPIPPLVIETGNHSVHLSWNPTDTVDPEGYLDPNRADGESKPFEGYRVYKSTVSPNGPWTLLAEYDLPGNNYGNDIGLARSYTENLLLNNVEYYYSVTAFSKEDHVLNWPSLESSISANVQIATPGPAPPSTVGEVAVVPNPYRGDTAYQNYNPAWERPPPTRERWLEQDRRLQFINLPSRCEIRIYTLTGEHIETLQHDDPYRGYEDWNLTSHVGQAVASGLYVFTVKDLNNGQIQVGKFVIIK